MPWRTSSRNSVLPAGFEPSEFIEAHQDRVKRSRGNAGLARDGIAVMPLAGTREEGLEDGEGLTRETEANAKSFFIWAGKMFCRPRPGVERKWARRRWFGACGRIVSL